MLGTPSRASCTRPCGCDPSTQPRCQPAAARACSVQLTECPVRWLDAHQIAQRKELAAQGETFLKALSAKLSMKDSDLKKQLNNMLKKAEQEKKQAAKKVSTSACFKIGIQERMVARH